jgi:hypothetical protein
LPDDQPLKSAPRSGREVLEALGLNQDFDGFLKLALVRLELLFEKDGARRLMLMRTEEGLADLEALAWPAPSTHRIRQARPEAVDAQTMGSVELAPGDLLSKPVSGTDAAVRRSGSWRLPALPPRNHLPRGWGRG